MLTAEQKELRKTGIGGSDVNAVYSLEPYGCAKRLYLNKTSDIDVDIDNPHIRRGNRQEPVARAVYTELLGREVKNLENSLVFVHKEHPFIRGFVDGLYNNKDGTPGGVLEIKCPGAQSFKRIKKEGLSSAWLLQLHHYLAIVPEAYGQRGSFAVYCAETDEMHVVDVERDEELINQVVASEVAFWGKVLALTPPDNLPQDDKRCHGCRYRETCWGEYMAAVMGAGTTDVTDAFDAYIAQYAEIQEAKSELDDAMDELKSEIIAKLGDISEVRSRTGGYLTYNVTVTNRWDTKALERDMPELGLKYKKESTTRTLRIYPRKD